MRAWWNGRHARFRSWWLYSLGGSSPSARTKSEFHNNGGASMRILRDDRLEKEVLLTISKNDFSRDLHAELLSQSSHVKKHGFRSGKVPVNIVFQERGGEAIDRIVRQAVSDAFAEIVGTRTIATPLSYRIETSLKGITLDTLPDMDIHVHAIFVPEIPAVEWKDIVLDRYIPCPTEAEIDESMSERAQRVMTSVPLKEKRKSVNGDTLVYTMRYAHQDGSVKETDGSFQLGSKTLPAEFENVLEGIEEGHVLTERMRVPKDFPDASLAGKKVEFSITFHEIRDTVPHQPDEAFAKSQGFETLEALRTEVKKSLVDSGEVLAELVLRKTLMAELGKTSSFEVPDSWVQSTLASLKKAHIRKIQAANPDASHDESVIDATIEKDLCERALRNVRADCVVQKVISENSFPVKDTELLNYARAMAQSEGKSLDEVVSILRKNKDMIDRISQDIQERKALLWISNQCTKEDKEVDLKTLNNRFNQEPSL